MEEVRDKRGVPETEALVRRASAGLFAEERKMEEVRAAERPQTMDSTVAPDSPPSISAAIEETADDVLELTGSELFSDEDAGT